MKNVNSLVLGSLISKAANIPGASKLPEPSVSGAEEQLVGAKRACFRAALAAELLLHSLASAQAQTLLPWPRPHFPQITNLQETCERLRKSKVLFVLDLVTWN